MISKVLDEEQLNRSLEKHMTDEKALVTKETDDFSIRNAIIPVFQNMPEGSERTVVVEIFERFNDYIQLQTGGIPGEGETDHQEQISKLKAAISFFMTMSQTLSALGLIANWKQSHQEMAKAIYERVLEERAKYRRTVGLIAEIYTVHLGGNGALFSTDAPPDEIRLEVERELKKRKLLSKD